MVEVQPVFRQNSLVVIQEVNSTRKSADDKRVVMIACGMEGLQSIYNAFEAMVVTECRH